MSRLRREALRRLQAAESEIQAAVLVYLEKHPNVAWAHRMNTGAVLVPETETTRRRFVRFAFKGCSDIIGQLVDGRFLAIEVKAARGRPTVEQQAFIDRVNAFAGVAAIVRSVTDAHELVTAAFTLRAPQHRARLELRG